MTSLSPHKLANDQADGLVVLLYRHFSQGSQQAREADEAHTQLRASSASLSLAWQPEMTQKCDGPKRPMTTLEIHQLHGRPRTRPENSICHEETCEEIHGRMRNFHAFSGLGTTLPCPVDEIPAYPHVEKTQGYMGNQGRSLNHFSPVRPPPKSRYRRNTSIFPSIPNPYYDD